MSKPPGGRGHRTISPDAVLTSGQVAALCKVAGRTVSKWMDAGLIKGYRIPLSKDRRFPAANVVEFLRASGMPIPRALLGAARPPVLFATFAAVDLFAAARAARPDIATATGDAIALAHLAGSDPPNAAVLGCEDGLTVTVRLAGLLLARGVGVRVAVILTEDIDPWDERLSDVRSRLCWLGRKPPLWEELVTHLRLTAKDNDNGQAEGRGTPERDPYSEMAG